MKPDWSNSPSWAKWLAMNKDGLWFWFDTKPSFDEEMGEWCISDECKRVDCVSLTTDESGIDWGFAFDTLEKKP